MSAEGDRIAAVLFDLDGTLVDQEAASAPAVRAWVAELGLPAHGVVDRWRNISSRHYARYQAREITFQEQRRERVRELLDRALTDDEADTLFEGYLRRYEAGWTIFADAIPCLERARAADLSVGILTNGDRAQQLQKVDRFGLDAHVDAIVCSSDLRRGKPHVIAFEAGTRALGHPAPRTLMVGDSVTHDVEGALAAGLSAVLLDRTGTSAAPGIRSIASLDELTFTG